MGNETPNLFMTKTHPCATPNYNLVKCAQLPPKVNLQN